MNDNQENLLKLADKELTPEQEENMRKYLGDDPVKLGQARIRFYMQTEEGKSFRKVKDEELIEENGTELLNSEKKWVKRFGLGENHVRNNLYREKAKPSQAELLAEITPQLEANKYKDDENKWRSKFRNQEFIFNSYRGWQVA